MSRIYKDYPIDDLAFVSSKFDPLAIKNARIFITGAGSWFGTWITSYLDFARIPYERFMKPYDRFPSGAFDYVLHLAQCPIRPILRFARRAQVKTFLFTSSGSVFNPDPDAKSNKLEEEGYLRDYGIDYRIARCYTMIGPGSPLRYAAGAFIDQAIRGQPIQVWHDGTSVRTYLYMADFVAWIFNILTKGVSAIYEVAGVKAIDMLELARRINLYTGNKGISIQNFYNDDIRPIYVPDPYDYEKSVKLGLFEWTGIDEAIKKTVEWYRD